MTVLRVNTIAGIGTTTFGPTFGGNLEFNSQNYIVLPKGSSTQQGVLRETVDVVGTGGTFYDNLVLAMPFNQANGLRDVSSRNRNPAAYGNVAISTAQSKYYGSSAYFDGSGDYIELTDTNNDFDLGGTNVTLECWVYPTVTSGMDVIIAKGGNTANWVLTDGFIYQLQYDPSTSKIVFYYNNGGGGAGVTGISGGTQSINSWYHVAVVTNTSNNITLYINGTSVATATNAISKPTIRTRFRLGTDLSNNDYQGYLQDLRIYKGIAKYTANFTPPDRIAEIGVGFTAGQLRYNTDSNLPELYDGNQWVQLSVSQVELGIGANTEPGARGLIAGGYFTSNFNNIEYITISSTGNSTDFGDLTEAKYIPSSCSSSTRGIFAGGDFATSPVSTYSNVMDYVTISSAGNAQDFGDLSSQKRSIGGCSNSTRGIFAGGLQISSPTNIRTNTIDYITINSTGNAQDFGDLTLAREGLSSCSNSTRGLFSSGNTPSLQNVIDYITIPTTGNATDFGDLINTYEFGSSCSNSTRGIFAGGRTPTVLNTISYVTISTLGNAIKFGELYTGAYGVSSCSSSTRGVFSGGVSPSSLNIIQYITILTQGNSIDFGDLTGLRFYTTSCSNAHGGL